VERRTLLTVALAVLAILAVAAAAATLDSTVSPDSGGSFGAGAGDSGAFGADNDADSSGTEESQFGGRPFVALCYPILNEPWLLGLILLGFLGVGALMRRSTGSWIPAFAIGLSLSIPAYVIHRILTNCGTPPGEPMGLPFGGNESSFLPRGGGQGSSLAQGTGVSTPNAVLGVLLVVALAGAVLLLFVSTADEEEEPDEPEGEPERMADVAAVGRAAGDAADRIEGEADVENEVYRAWDEMTRLLELPNPEAATPAEFAAVAVDAGIDADDVSELTDLFEAVRYGGVDPTEDRERRAVAALRRIEDEYADAEGGDG
jgi:hypothetical protein